MTKKECLHYLDWQISLGYKNEYIFNSFMFASNDDVEGLENDTMYNFINIINKDDKYIDLQKINEAYIYSCTKRENEIDLDKEKILDKLGASLVHIKEPDKYYKINNTFKRCCTRERKENAVKKGIELEDISGDEGEIDKNYRFTMPHNKNSEYQYYSFTLEKYEELEELNSICNSLRNKRGLTKGEKMQKRFFERKINKILEDATVVDYDKKNLIECVIELSKLEGKNELSENEKIKLTKLKRKKDELERKINNR